MITFGQTTKYMKYKIWYVSQGQQPGIAQQLISAQFSAAIMWEWHSIERLLIQSIFGGMVD